MEKKEEKKKLIRLRVCVSCKKNFEQSKLIRILLEHKTQTWILKPNKKQFGRSIYVCDSENCLGKLAKNKKYSKLIGIIKSK